MDTHYYVSHFHPFLINLWSSALEKKLEVDLIQDGHLIGKILTNTTSHISTQSFCIQGLIKAWIFAQMYIKAWHIYHLTEV